MKTINLNRNLKKFFFSISSITIALTLGALTTVKYPYDIYAQTSPGIYTLVNYNEGTCLLRSYMPCAYHITYDGKLAGLQNNYQLTVSEITNYLNQSTPYLELIGKEKRMFVSNYDY